MKNKNQAWLILIDHKTFFIKSIEHLYSCIPYFWFLVFFYFVTKSDQKPKSQKCDEQNINLVKLRGLKNRNTTSERILSPLYLRFIVSSVDVKEKNWSSDLQWNAVTNRHSRSVTHPCETKVIKQHLLQINLKASRSVTQSNTVYWTTKNPTIFNIIR